MMAERIPLPGRASAVGTFSKKIGKLLHLALRRWKVVWSKVPYAPPVPLPRRRSFWLALALVALAAAAYSIYFIIFVTSKQDAFLTNGEDLGIMDQAIWNTLHGAPLQQTICNVLTDTNCYSLEGISRFAIHFEPILFPIALLYLCWAGPKTLLIFQVLVVATGAFPAFWLARLRLRNDWAAVPFALLYLLYPAQQYAVDYDFHAVTLTLSLLLFALYFMYTQRNGWFLAFVILSLACKEEVAGVVAMMGLWIMLCQHRWRLGLIILLLALGWTAIGLLVVHYASPLGYSLLASRWSDYGNSPVAAIITILRHPLAIIREHVLEPQHVLYLRKLLSPAGYLPLLAPWALMLAAPTLALNLLSTNPNMYSGDFQYNAEIVPVLIFATIEATVVILWLAERLFHSLLSRPDAGPARPAPTAPARRFSPTGAGLLRAGLLILLLAYILQRVVAASARYDVYSAMPYASGFSWPVVTSHDLLAYRFLNEIPANASVTAQTNLVPHLSERRTIYLFPYGVGYADYILLNAPGYYYPFLSYDDYAHTVDSILRSDEYGVLDMQDGYFLLEKGYSTADNKQAMLVIESYRHSD
jgi:uncharacterized membrane protein